MRFITSRAVADGEKRDKPMTFRGWAYVSAEEIMTARHNATETLTKLDIVASPVADPEPNDNPYHAHVVRPAAVDDYFMALHLREVVQRRGGVLLRKRIEQQRGPLQRMLEHPALSWLKRMVTHLKPRNSG